VNYAWPAAVAFIGMCAAIAYAAVYTSEPKSAQVACIEQHGHWIPSTFGGAIHSTCEFPAAPSSK